MRRAPRALASLLPLLPLLAGGCDAAGPAGPLAADPPMGKADGGDDAADHGCRVVLRELARPGDGAGGFEVAGGSWLWLGALDVASDELAAGAAPAILYQYGSDPTWYEVGGVVGDADPFARTTRVVVRLDQGLPGPGLSGSALAAARVRVIPFLHTAAGGRLFDHNRRAGELETYELTLAGGFAVAADPDACAPPPKPVTRLGFADDWSERQDGAIVAGGELVIDYDLDRLTACRGTHNGHPAWTLDAQVRFLPGGQTASATVRAFESDFGVPTNVAYAVPARFAVPPDARGVDVYFTNHAVPNCNAFDSNDGQDYRFHVVPPPAWVGGGVVRLTRDTGDRCAGGTAMADGFRYDGWVRERAAIRNACLEAWSPGVTDRGDPAVWRSLDVRARYRFDDGELATAAVGFDATVGDNARFAWDLRAADPFAWPATCLAVPTVAAADGIARVATMEYLLTVNGVELRPAAGQLFRGEFEGPALPACP